MPAKRAKKKRSKFSILKKLIDIGDLKFSFNVFSGDEGKYSQETGDWYIDNYVRQLSKKHFPVFDANNPIKYWKHIVPQFDTERIHYIINNKEIFDDVIYGVCLEMRDSCYVKRQSRR